MEKRKWLWKRKSSERSNGETESSGSISSHLERYSDDQEAFNASSPNSTKSPEVSSKALAVSEDVNDSIRSLTEKLSAALANISAKDDLVNQHSKVAEEAIAGWETAENEVVVIKQKFEDAVQQNSALEDKVSHLDGALKECVRQLRQAREGHERKIYEGLKRENSALKLELSSRLEELEIRTIERDLSIQAAETASKQHLESIKKVAKLDAECRRLKSIGSKSSFVNRTLLKSIGSKSSFVNRTLTGSSIEIDLMDDFLEMEQLAALPKTTSENQCLGPKAIVKQSMDGDSSLKVELEAMIHRTKELEEKLEKIELDKYELEIALAKSQESLEASELQLRKTELKSEELHIDLYMANEAKQHLESQLGIMETDAETMSAKIDALVAEIEKEKALSMQISVNANESKQEARMKSAKIDSLIKQVENEKAFSAQITVKCRELEEELSRKRQEAEFRQTANSNVEVKIKQEDLAFAAGKLVECQKTIASLGQQLKSLATLEDFLIDTTSIPLPEFVRGGSPAPKSGEPWQLHSDETYSTRVSADHSGVPITPSSSSSSSIVPSNHASSEKNRNGFANFFTRSKNGIQLEI